MEHFYKFVRNNASYSEEKNINHTDKMHIYNTQLSPEVLDPVPLADN